MRRIFAALHRSSPSESIDLLNNIRLAENVEDAISAVTPKLNPLPMISSSSEDPTDRYESKSPSARISSTLWSKQLPLSRWTSVISDDETLSHLFYLFWTWDTTLPGIIDRKMLLEDLYDAQENHGNERPLFCSKLLVNSILSVSTSFVRDGDGFDRPVPKGCAFADEAYRQLEQHMPESKITLIQGLAILSTYESNFGDRAKAAGLLENLDQLRSTPDPFETQALCQDNSQARREGRILEALDFISMVSRPVILPVPRQFRRSEDFELLGWDEDSVDDIWCPYPMSMDPQVSLFWELLNAKYELAEFASEAVSQIDLDHNSPVPDYPRAKALYSRLARWYEGVCQQWHSDASLIPSCVFLSTLFSTLAIRLLEPFTKLSFLGFGSDQTALSLSLSHGQSIVSGLLNYRTAFGMRHDYWLMNACYTAAKSLLFNYKPESGHGEALMKSLELLHDMGHYMPRANRVLLALRIWTTKARVHIPDNASTFLNAGALKAQPIVITNVRIFDGLEDNNEGRDQVHQLVFAQDIVSVVEDVAP
ncbi:Nitrogen assimilation transcription factor nit-4-like protein [Cladobotryum mycophilum]|uniref:Nitrogen assimilation transcription factor nit-4-like protein n=1 Tax=Cladobotryum mycophilum TaxID=491253 RepID=A0ABR0SNY3_9HYPO